MWACGAGLFVYLCYVQRNRCLLTPSLLSSFSDGGYESPSLSLGSCRTRGGRPRRFFFWESYRMGKMSFSYYTTRRAINSLLMVADERRKRAHSTGFTLRKLNLNLQQRPSQLWLSPPTVFQV